MIIIIEEYMENSQYDRHNIHSGSYRSVRYTVTA
jgi:hypothetical protein